MTDHGRLFDRFPAMPSHGHGGSYFDTGFGRAAWNEAHGRLHDQFGIPREGTEKHGERWDEFGWHAMPTIHGQNFDTDFQAPVAGQGEHGSTWFDVFRGGRTQARVMVNGQDVEGTVIECSATSARVRARDGQTHEVGLEQFLAYRTPNEHQAAPTIPESTAEAPSAHSADAHGAFHGDRTPVPTGDRPKVSEVPQGQYTEPRSGVPAGLMDTFTRLKSATEALDVTKSVDTTATAIQGGGGKTVGHRANCPREGGDPCGPDVDGHCTLCNATVRDHEAVGKTDTPLGITVPEREHSASDHHMTLGAKPGRCPHCGAIIDVLDEKADQGAPTRTHKCARHALDVLKEALA